MRPGELAHERREMNLAEPLDNKSQSACMAKNFVDQTQKIEFFNTMGSFRTFAAICM